MVPATARREAQPVSSGAARYPPSGGTAAHAPPRRLFSAPRRRFDYAALVTQGSGDTETPPARDQAASDPSDLSLDRPTPIVDISREVEASRHNTRETARLRMSQITRLVDLTRADVKKDEPARAATPAAQQARRPRPPPSPPPPVTVASSFPGAGRLDLHRRCRRRLHPDAPPQPTPPAPSTSAAPAPTLAPTPTLAATDAPPQQRRPRQRLPRQRRPRQRLRSRCPGAPIPRALAERTR